VQVLATPGHSDGSVSIWDPASRAVLTSDAILGDSLHYADGRAAFPPTYRDPAQYLRTIATIEALEPQWLLTAHEPVMHRAEARVFLERSRHFAAKLERAVLAELDEHARGRTTQELITALAPRMGQWEEGAWMFLANELVGHLEELVAAGVAEMAPGDPVVWRLAEEAR
jgi:glyoxylase-like metal-dependent hydrolase (beta-lactamase superfamily II)